MNRKIPFYIPDIGDDEIQKVSEILKSGWITTGKYTKQFEEELAGYCGAEKSVCLNSATAGLELVLRLLRIENGDEVITSPYSFVATSNVILYVGAKPVFADTKPDGFHMDPEKIAGKITKKTKAVIPVDFAGYPADYDAIFEVLSASRKKYKPKAGTLQEQFNRIPVIADAAHSLGAVYGNRKIGSVADFSVFSFQAVKNVTTAEGGAVLFNALTDISAADMYKRLKLSSLHGMDREPYLETIEKNWKYSIETLGYKCNMTDIAAGIGLIQFRKYLDSGLRNRFEKFGFYSKLLKDTHEIIKPQLEDGRTIGSGHLYTIRIREADEEKRNSIIAAMSELGITLNVHYIPIVMHSYYRRLGYDTADYPNCYDSYKNEISLPLFSKLNEDDMSFICTRLIKEIKR